MKRIMLISLLFIVACAGINADDVQTDKIQLLFGDYDYKRLHDGAIDDKEMNCFPNSSFRSRPSFPRRTF